MRNESGEGAEDVAEAAELDRIADWRIKKVGEEPGDVQSARAAELLQKLAADVRRARGAPTYIEYVAILNWLGEFDVVEDFSESALDYRVRIGVDFFPENGEAYLRALIDLARKTAGA
jgi:hypothetical protein